MNFTNAELKAFTTDFVGSLNRGISLLDCLDSGINNPTVSNNHQFKNALLDVKKQVSQGQVLSKVMAEHPAYFDSHYVSVVRTGEVNGELDIELARLNTTL